MTSIFPNEWQRSQSFAHPEDEELEEMSEMVKRLPEPCSAEYCRVSVDEQ